MQGITSPSIDGAVFESDEGGQGTRVTVTV